LRLRLSARRLATLGGFSAFLQVVSEPPHERRTRLPLERFVVRGRARSETVEAEMLTSEGLKGPKRAEVLKCY
jgi:hypothetical protein